MDTISPRVSVWDEVSVGEGPGADVEEGSGADADEGPGAEEGIGGMVVWVDLLFVIDQRWDEQDSYYFVLQRADLTVSVGRRPIKCIHTFKHRRYYKSL